MKNTTAVSVCAVMSAMAVVACAAQDPITLATIDVDASSVKAASADAAVPCSVSDPGSACSDAEFCAANSCGSTDGKCKPVPATCPNEYAPECGCDGITYFNGCLRETARKSLAGDGPCGLGETQGCRDVSDCKSPANACALVISLRRDSRNPFCPDSNDAGTTRGRILPSVGICWTLPSTCPASSYRFSSCTSGCVDLCSAIQSGGALVRCDAPAEDASTN